MQIMIINVSSGKQSYSQRNNAVKPLESCNVTSMIMALDYLGYQLPKGEYDQPEDNLRIFIESYGKNPEIHAELSKYTNKWMGRDVTNFSTSRKINDILSEILAGRPVVISGTYPGFPTKRAKPLGHIVCLVGAEWDNKTDWIGPPDYVFWDDPYGNTLLDWKGSGNDIKIDYQKFVDWIKPIGNASVKWGHFFIKP
jgi:uncharacterized protein YvpB